MSYKQKEQYDGRVAVVTSTMLGEYVHDALASIIEQDVEPKCYFYIDAVDLTDEQERRRENLELRAGRNVLWLNENTGAGGYFGHRIYGAAAFLVNRCDYITWCDDDNLMLPGHLESLLETARSNDLGFAYSLRSIIDDHGAEVCKDNCESLGHWPPYTGAPNLIDVSCMLMPVSLAVQLAPIWYARAHVPGDMPPDRGLAYHLLLNSRKIDPDPRTFCTGRHTLGYRAGGGSGLSPTFWLKGNAASADKYGDDLPWIK